jgi:hypothetical protein
MVLPLPITVSRNTKFIKISKFDNNGKNNSTVLENVTKILVYNSFYNSYTPYDVEILNEQQIIIYIVLLLLISHLNILIKFLIILFLLL